MTIGMMSPPDVKRRATAYATISHTLSNSRVFANAGSGFRVSGFGVRVGGRV